MKTHVRHSTSFLRLGAGLLALAAFQVSAQNAVGVSGFDRFMALTTGGTSTISFSGQGVPLAANPVSAPVVAGRFGIAADAATKGLSVSGAANLGIGTAGRTVPLAVTGKVSKAALGAAFKGLLPLVGGWPGLAVVGALGLIDWYTSSGVKIGTDGKPYREEMDTNCSSTGQCYEFQYSTNGWKSASAACQDGIAYYNANGGGVNVYSLRSFVLDSCIANRSYNGGAPSTQSFNTSKRTVTTPPSLKQVPITDDQAIAQMTDPLIQVKPEVLKDLFTIDQSGRYSDKALKDLAITNVIASGPATVAGVTSTSTTPATSTSPATSTQTKTDYNCVFVMADVTCTDKKTETTTVTDSATGAQTVTTKTTNTEAAKPSEPTPDPCDIHPERVGCAALGTPTDQQLTKKPDYTVTVTAQDFATMAGCIPPLTFAVLGRTYMIAWTPLCDIMIYIKAIITALCALIAFYVLADSFRVS